MSFVKLDTGILDSTLWLNRDERDVFVTALLMAEPLEVERPIEQIAADKLELTGFVVPAGWYGFIRAAGPGIVRRALVAAEDGIAALIRLGSPDPESRTPDHGGRRLVRVDGGYLVLNFMRYRDKDNTTAERSRRYRERQKSLESVAASRRDGHGVTRDSSLADADAEADIQKQSEKQKPVQPSAAPCRFAEFWLAYPNKKSRQEAEKTWRKLKLDPRCDDLIAHVRLMSATDSDWLRGYAPMGSTYLNQARWEDVPKRPPTAGTPVKTVGKQMQGLMALEGLKSGNRLDSGRNRDGAAEALPALVGPDTRR